MSNEQNVAVAIKYDPVTKTWQMQEPNNSNGQWAGAPDYYPITIAAKNTGKITFTIQGGNAQFQKDGAAISDVAILSGKGKPLTGGHSGQLDNINTTSQQSVLKVTDKNKNATPFDINYVLHFQNGVPDLDPIIKNGGDPPMTRSLTSDIGILLLGAAVLALIAFFIGRRMARG